MDAALPTNPDPMVSASAPKAGGEKQTDEVSIKKANNGYIVRCSKKPLDSRDVGGYESTESVFPTLDEAFAYSAQEFGEAPAPAAEPPVEEDITVDAYESPEAMQGAPASAVGYEEELA